MFCHQRQVGTGAPEGGRAVGDQWRLTGSGCVIGAKGGTLVAKGDQLAACTGSASVSASASSASAAAVIAAVDVRVVMRVADRCTVRRGGVSGGGGRSAPVAVERDASSAASLEYELAGRSDRTEGRSDSIPFDSIRMRPVTTGTGGRRFSELEPLLHSDASTADPDPDWVAPAPTRRAQLDAHTGGYESSRWGIRNANGKNGERIGKTACAIEVSRNHHSNTMRSRAC